MIDVSPSEGVALGTPDGGFFPIAMFIERGGDLGAVLPYEAPPAPPVESVTPWQAREALRLAGLLGAVNAHIDALGDAHAAYIAWHYAERIRRHSPFVESIAPLLGLTESQLDSLFTQAAGLSL
jgi:hypothetical protein